MALWYKYIKIKDSKGDELWGIWEKCKQNTVKRGEKVLHDIKYFKELMAQREIIIIIILRGYLYK